MEKSNKRGKIPQADWPLIMVRYEAGETLASIARTYDCSPPAISYIVSRNRGKPTNEAPAPVASEPQLIKANGNGASGNGAESEVVIAAEPTEATPPVQRDGIERPTGAPAPRPSPPGNGEHRPKLHLGFGNGNGYSNGHNPGNGAREQQAQPAPRPFQAPPRANPFDSGQGARDFVAPHESRPPGQTAPQMPHDDAPARKNGAAALDQELRSRVDGDVTAFLAAFDAGGRLD